MKKILTLVLTSSLVVCITFSGATKVLGTPGGPIVGAKSIIVTQDNNVTSYPKPVVDTNSVVVLSYPGGPIVGIKSVIVTHDINNVTSYSKPVVDTNSVVVLGYPGGVIID